MWVRSVLISAVLLAPSTVAAVHLEVGTSSAWPGEAVEIDVVLRTEGSAVAATENVLRFGPALSVDECRPNPRIGKDVLYSVGTFDCPGGSCASLKAIVISFSDLTPIPDGLPMYTCRIQVAADSVPMTHPIRCDLPGGSSPEGDALETTCSDGAVLPPDGKPPQTVPTSTPWSTGGTPTPVRDRPTRTRRPTQPVPTATLTDVSAVGNIAVETDRLSVSAFSGGEVTVRAFVSNAHGNPLDGVVVLFEFEQTGITTLRRLAARTRDGFAELTIDIPPRSASGELIVRASAAGLVGLTSISIVPGQASSPASRRPIMPASLAAV